MSHIGTLREALGVAYTAKSMDVTSIIGLAKEIVEGRCADSRLAIEVGRSAYRRSQFLMRK